MRKACKACKAILLFSLLYPLMGSGCSSTPVFTDAGNIPSVVRTYKHVSLYRGGREFTETGIHIKKGDLYSVLPSVYYYRNTLMVRIGQDDRVFSPFYHNRASSSGLMSLRFPFSSPNFSHFAVDIIVWEKEDWPQIADVLNQLKQRDPGNQTLVYALEEALRRRDIFLAEAETSQEIEEVTKELEALKVVAGSKTDQAVSSPTKAAPAPAGAVPAEETETREKHIRLEERLAELTAKLAEYEEMKQRLHEEQQKADYLAKELEEREQEQKELRTRLQLGPKTLPVIVIASPEDGSKVERSAVDVSGVAESDLGVERIEISVNDRHLGERGWEAKKEGGPPPRRMEFRKRIPLVVGENRVRIRAVDAEGLSSEKGLTIRFEELRKNIWGVVIGINQYQKAPQLKYAVNDARAFYEYLVRRIGTPRENVTLLLNHEAGLGSLRSTLGTQLKNKAGKEDMVILYFAGHGATESDVMSPDGDGLEKYLLPFDADPKDLYASALPMREISHILQRIRSERLVFIIDSCYSGASGGRTVRADGVRANISDRFLDRIAGGRGTIILTASGPNEVSLEKEELGHGVFTYFLLEGLEGKADMDGDGQITVDEAYDYVSRNVPKATGQEQNPVKKGSVEGRLILGILP
jgi:hypothetical protein